jgi:hypothetical protein
LVSLSSFDAIAPRYLAYCRAHGATPEEQRAADAKRYLGGWTIGYVFWVRHELAAWCALNGRFRLEMNGADHVEFTEWLGKKHAPPALGRYIRDAPTR